MCIDGEHDTEAIDNALGAQGGEDAGDDNSLVDKEIKKKQQQQQQQFFGAQGGEGIDNSLVHRKRASTIPWWTDKERK